MKQLFYSSILLLTTLSAADIVQAQNLPSIVWADDRGVNQIDLNTQDLISRVGIKISRPTDLELDTENGKMYWCDSGTHVVSRANLDGSDLEVILAQGIPPSCDIELDVAENKMYWIGGAIPDESIMVTDLNGENSLEILSGDKSTLPTGLSLDLGQKKLYWIDFDTIKRSNLDGTMIETLITKDIGYPSSMTLDINANKMYWIDLRNELIQRANLDGSAIETLISIGSIASPYLAFHAPTGKLYWIEGGNKIMRANSDGSEPEIFIGNNLLGVQDLAFYSDIDRVYWTENGAIKRASFAATNREELIKRRLGFIDDVAVDPATGTLFWVSDGSNGEFQGLQRIDYNEAVVKDLHFDNDSQSMPENVALDLERQKIYWTDSSNESILRANLDGTGAELIIDGELNSPLGIDLDHIEQKIYWADFASDLIQRANLDGSEIETIVSNLDQPLGVALDLQSGKIYWTTTAFQRESIQRANLDGSGVETVIDNLDSPIGISLDLANGKVYWTELNSAILRANLDGSNVETLDIEVYNPRGLRVVYFSETVNVEKNLIHRISSSGIGNFPNPFISSTSIQYQLEQTANVEIIIFSLLGKEIRRIQKNSQLPGIHEMMFYAENLPAGIYYYRISTDSSSKTRAMTMLR